MVSYVVHLLLQSSLGLGQHVDLVLLGLKVIENLLVGLLQGSFLSAQRRYGFIQNTHLLGQVLHLDGEEKSRKLISSTHHQSCNVKEACSDTSLTHLILQSMSVFLHFGQGYLQIVHVSFQ